MLKGRMPRLPSSQGQQTNDRMFAGGSGWRELNRRPQSGFNLDGTPLTPAPQIQPPQQPPQQPTQPGDRMFAGGPGWRELNQPVNRALIQKLRGF